MWNAVSTCNYYFVSVLRLNASSVAAAALVDDLVGAGPLTANTSDGFFSPADKVMANDSMKICSRKQLLAVSPVVRYSVDTAPEEAVLFDSWPGYAIHCAPPLQITVLPVAYMTLYQDNFE